MWILWYYIHNELCSRLCFEKGDNLMVAVTQQSMWNIIKDYPESKKQQVFNFAISLNQSEDTPTGDAFLSKIDRHSHTMCPINNFIIFQQSRYFRRIISMFFPTSDQLLKQYKSLLRCFLIAMQALHFLI